MSLQVWLPLNGNLQNKGLNQISVTNTGAIVNNKGKIGQCYSFNTSSSYMIFSKEAMTSLTAEASVCFWLKINAWNTSYATFFQAGLGGTAWTHYIFGFLRNNANSTCCFTISNGSSASNASYLTPALELNTWYHIGLIYKTGHCLIYINGQLYQDYTTSIVPNFAGITKITLGKCNNTSYYQTNCDINDFRIYDHVLSLKEIKEISKGLVLHYPLNQNLGLGLNLVKNGFGQLGTENWQSPGNRSTTEIPSGHSQIKASFFNNVTDEYIPINKNATYKLQLYIKANSGSTALMYPSIYPYDIDKKFINHFNTPMGFNLNTLTTLTQPLNPGDTKIYVADLSNWNANSGHYYNEAAIFNYQDSTGYIYEVGEYTQNTPRFGSSTNAKTNLDKINNIITLISPYAGPPVLVGTSICASTEGATYFYPFGALSGSNYQDWRYISKEFVPALISSRLKNVSYIRYYTGWSHQYEAGIRITDLSTLDTIMSDDSGYLQNGTLNGTFENSMDTPRYSASQKFTGTNYVSLPSPCEEVKTISLWVKWDTIPSGQSVVFVDYKSKLGFGLMSTGILCSTQGPGNSYTFSKANIVANTWYHFVIINPGAVTSVDRKLYINGVEQTHTSSVSYWSYTIDQLQLGKRSTTSDGFKGLISDFRMYSSVLSEEDILQLYHTAAIADRNGNLYIRELVEI